MTAMYEDQGFWELTATNVRQAVRDYFEPLWQIRRSVMKILLSGASTMHRAEGHSEPAAVPELERELAAAREAVASFVGHFNDMYASVVEGVRSLSTLRRFEWATLTDRQWSIAMRALNDFRTIPGFVLQREGREHPYEFTNVLAALGMSALYTGQIVLADNLLRLGEDVGRQLEKNEESRSIQGRISYARGMLSKNWMPKGTTIDERLQEARTLFETALDVRNSRTDVVGELTLAETLTYIPGQMQRAADILQRIIRSMEEIGPDRPYAYTLLGRAYVLQGNISVLEGDAPSARRWYAQALKVNPESHTVRAYLGLSGTEGERRPWFEGLFTDLQRALLASPTTDVLQQVTWYVLFIIAAHESGRDDMQSIYTEHLMQVADRIRSMSPFQPLFLSPISKGVGTIDTLLRELAAYVNGSK